MWSQSQTRIQQSIAGQTAMALSRRRLVVLSPASSSSSRYMGCHWGGNGAPWAAGQFQWPPQWMAQKPVHPPKVYLTSFWCKDPLAWFRLAEATFNRENPQVQSGFAGLSQGHCGADQTRAADCSHPGGPIQGAERGAGEAVYPNCVRAAVWRSLCSGARWPAPFTPYE